MIRSLPIHYPVYSPVCYQVSTLVLRIVNSKYLSAMLYLLVRCSKTVNILYHTCLGSIEWSEQILFPVG